MIALLLSILATLFGADLHAAGTLHAAPAGVPAIGSPAKSGPTPKTGHPLAG